MRKLYFISIAAAAATTAAVARGDISSEDFVHKASIANMFEIQSSQLALKKSEDENVKNFAKHMVEDHTQTGEKMKEALQSSKLRPEGSFDSKHAQLLNTLNKASGKDFDRKYVSIQTDAHKEAVSLFDSYATDGKDSVLKNFAAQTLPTLQGHLKEVKQLKVD